MSGFFIGLMEPSNAGSWLTNFEMNYSSFFQEFDQFDELAPSPLIPDLSSFSPDECCLSNSLSDPDPSPEVYTISPPPERNLSNVAINQAKEKKKPRNKSWNSCLTKERNGPGTDGEGLLPSTNIQFRPVENSDGIDNLNLSSNGRGRKRSYEATADGSREKNTTSSANPVVQPGFNRKDHVMAERKRREKLTQRFIALSSLVPGLTRMDKASVLGDAIKHVKHLQERVKTLEAQATSKTVQSSVIVKKSQLSSDECNSSTCEDDSPVCELPTTVGSLPEVEVRISQQRVLVKILCENQKGVLVKALSEIEKLGVTVLSTSAMPFTSSSFDVTVTAKIDEEFSLTVQDIVKRLNLAIKQH